MLLGFKNFSACSDALRLVQLSQILRSYCYLHPSHSHQLRWIRFNSTHATKNTRQPPKTDFKSLETTHGPHSIGKTNELSQILSKLIDITGPIPLSAYMRQCLTHPTLGYYTTRDPLGSRGDFTTSPEVSPLFGEMLGVWYFSIWEQQGKPTNINFVEFGPGRGTLMADVLRVFNSLTEKQNDARHTSGGGVKVNVVMVETSPVLKRVQCEKLTGSQSSLNVESLFWEAPFEGSRASNMGKITWCDTELDLLEVINLETDCNFIIAHEFFDALPINLFKKTSENKWRELLVDKNGTANGQFHLTQSPKETPSCKIPLSNARYNQSPVGSVIEISPESYKYIQSIGNLISRNSKGAALIFDYGTESSIPSNTLRGIQNHRFVNPFTRPGEVDLSINVDFKALELTALEIPEVESLGITTQGEWLVCMGILSRLEILLKGVKNKEERKVIIGAVKRLIHDKEMGKVYKVCGLVPKGMNKESIAGFQRL